MRFLHVLTFVFTLTCFVFFNTPLTAQQLEVYVSDAGGFNIPPWQILKFDQQGNNPEVFIDDNLAWPQDIVFLEDQEIVLISNLSSNRITRHNATTGAYINNFATNANGPTRMKIGADGLLYVLQWNNPGRVKRYQLNGDYVDDFTSVGVSQSIGLDWDSEGNLYVSSYNGRSVRKFSPTGEDLGLFISSNLQGPTNIWFDENGDLLVADYNGTSVKRFDSNGQFLGNYLTGLSNCEGIAFFPNGDILVGNGATRSVKLFDKEGNYIEDFISTGAGGLRTPNAVVIRDVTAVGIEDWQKETQFVKPSIGTQFFCDGEAFPNINSLEIYSASGQLIEKIGGSEPLVWEATSQAEGLYILVGKQENRIIVTQKVLVKK